jgi:sugar (pentulose or hexulose) kinase
MNDGPILLGLDLGISTARAALFRPDGALLGIESEEYLIIPQGDRVEADPEVYWSPIARAIRGVLAKWAGDPARVAAVSVSSHAETVIPIGSDGRPARQALVWMDNRSRAEAEELAATLGPQKVLEISGQPEIGPIWPVTKLRWLSKHESDLVKSKVKFLLPEDYILYRLSGEFAGEYSLWASSLLIDIRTKAWSDSLLEFAGISASQLPTLYPSATAFSTVSDECAAETGLRPETRVVTGGLDQACAAIGVANIAPGIITESTGSVLALLATIAHPVFDAETKVPCHVHVLPDTYCLLPWNPTGGLTLKWFKDRFACDLRDKAQTTGDDVYDLLTTAAGDIPPGSGGLVMLPHLEGAFFPEFDPQARGVFFGFTLAHTRAHFTRAIMESIAFMIRRDIAGLVRLGVAPTEVRVLGGGAKSRIWSQIKADVCNLPVIMPDQSEAAVLGAAMLAAVGAGLYSGIPSAVNAMSREGLRLEPNPSTQEVYERAFGLYASLYEAGKSLFPESSAIDSLFGHG